jgi:hypothetical protein
MEIRLLSWLFRRKPKSSVKLIVDSSYALDYLSILEVKWALSPSDQNSKNYLTCLGQLRRQIKNFEKILLSDEYGDLLDSNFCLFNKIDDLRDGKEMSAKVLDDLNLKRFEAKRKLQQKYFGGELTEVKTKFI